MENPRKNGLYSYRYLFIVIVLIICIGSYLLFYVPYENRVAYQQNVECSDLVTQAETSNEAKITQVVTGQLIFGTPQSHFNKMLNTCLGDFSWNDTITINKVGYIYLNYWIEDVVSNKNIASSSIEMTPSATTLSGGVPQAEFKQQEAILMSE